MSDLVEQRLTTLETTVDRTIGILEEMVGTLTKIADLLEKLLERK